MVIGGGLTRGKGVLDAITAVIKKTKLPENSVITPHSHEFFVLSGKKPSSDAKERKKLAQELALRFGSVVLLKGHIDIISDRKRAAANKTGNPCMTKGGFGDTLAGITGALLARISKCLSENAVFPDTHGLSHGFIRNISYRFLGEL